MIATGEFVFVAVKTPISFTGETRDGAGWHITGSNGQERYTDDEIRKHSRTRGQATAVGSSRGNRSARGARPERTRSPCSTTSSARMTDRGRDMEIFGLLAVLVVLALIFAPDQKASEKVHRAYRQSTSGGTKSTKKGGWLS